MNQIFHRLPSECTDRILCCYNNETSELLVARITNIPNWRFERVIFPRERLLFEAPSSALLEIHKNTPQGPTCTDSIPCTYLGVADLGKPVGATNSNTISGSSMTHKARTPQKPLKI